MTALLLGKCSQNNRTMTGTGVAECPHYACIWPAFSFHFVLLLLPLDTESAILMFTYCSYHPCGMHEGGLPYVCPIPSVSIKQVCIMAQLGKQNYWNMKKQGSECPFIFHLKGCEIGMKVHSVCCQDQFNMIG